MMSSCPKMAHSSAITTKARVPHRIQRADCEGGVSTSSSAAGRNSSSDFRRCSGASWSRSAQAARKTVLYFSERVMRSLSLLGLLFAAEAAPMVRGGSRSYGSRRKLLLRFFIGGAGAPGSGPLSAHGERGRVLKFFMFAAGRRGGGRGRSLWPATPAACPAPPAHPCRSRRCAGRCAAPSGGGR